MMIFLICTLMLAGLVAAAWQFRTAHGSTSSRAVRAMTAVSMAAVTVVLLMRMMQGTSQDWNEAKLAPVIGMTRGYALYQNPQLGAMTGWIYGPIGAIVLLPTAIARDPTTAVLIGIALSAFYYLAPVGLALALASRGRAPLLAVVAFLAVAWESFNAESLSRCIIIAAPDAPALGLAACACAAIYANRSARNLLLSALAAILCVWTKQNYAPLLLGLLIWVAILDGMKAAGMYLGFLAGIGIIISAILLPLFGASNMWYHMVTLPGSHPWRDTEHNVIIIWLLGIHDLVLASSTNLGLLALVAVLDGMTSQQATSARQWLAQRPWMVYALIAVLLIPGSLIGYLKVGGHVNSLACTDFFLLLAAACGLVEIGAKLEPQSAIKQMLEAGLAVFGLVLGLNALLGSTNGLLQTWPQVAHPYDTPQQRVFEYVRAHPEEVYCPWNPLTTLLADGKLYHFEWGLIDRLAAKEPLTPQHVRNHLPAKMNKIVYLRPPQSTNAMEILPQFRTQTTVPGLEGSIVYTR
jgi:hypothetical protein